MREYITGALAACLTAAFLFYVSQQTVGAQPPSSTASGTACVPKAGAPTTLACQTGADADSGALTANKEHRIMCDTDAWIDFAAAASNAAVDDMYLPAFQAHYFTTARGMLHVSCLSVAVNGDCRISECQ